MDSTRAHGHFYEANAREHANPKSLSPSSGVLAFWRFLFFLSLFPVRDAEGWDGWDVVCDHQRNSDRSRGQRVLRRVSFGGGARAACQGASVVTFM